MQVQELQDVVRRDIPISYRRSFTATALMGNDTGTEPKRIEFVLEQSPLGSISVRVKFLEDIDYPLVPALAALKAHIEQMDREGLLP